MHYDKIKIGDNMEKKKVTKKTTKNAIVKKVTPKKKTDNKTKKKGFTLIELLAVIIILGILMIIAIPSVTKYISDSRKNAYVDTAKEIVSGARNKVNEGELGMYDTNTTYYIPASYIETENASKSPYGDFTEAYVGVVYDGVGYKYYWISCDDAGQGVSKITPVDILDTDDIVSDLSGSDITSVIETTGIGSRSEIKIYNPSTNSWNGVVGGAVNTVSEGTGTNVVEYPTEKTKATVTAGEIVKIGSEEFYVISNDGTNLVLLARYNLKVGDIYDSNENKIGQYSSSDSGYGLQSSEAIGWATSGNYNGTMAFSNSNYWDNKVGTTYPGVYCSNPNGPNCVVVFDGNSYLSQYVNSYRQKIEKIGAAVKEARLLSLEEAFSFRNINYNAFKETSYWLGTACSSTDMCVVSSGGYFGGLTYTNYSGSGVRPVIVI